MPQSCLGLLFNGKIMINEDYTYEEVAINMLLDIEKKMETGPIVGEAREVVIMLCENIVTRNLMINRLGISYDQIEELRYEIGKEMFEHDRAVLERRNKTILKF